MKIDTLINTTFKITLCLSIVLAAFNLVGSNLLATQGHQLQGVHQQTAQLEKQNTRLKNQIAQQSSLASLESWADSQGFVKIDQPLALTAAAPVAYVSQ